MRRTLQERPSPEFVEATRVSRLAGPRAAAGRVPVWHGSWNVFRKVPRKHPTEEPILSSDTHSPSPAQAHPHDASPSRPASSSSATAERLSGSSSVLIERGFLSGVIGAAVVAVFFAVVDGLRGELFHTPHLLGSVLFTDATPATLGPIQGPMVMAYTAVHLGAFVAVGLAVAWLLAQAERYPPFAVMLVLLFFCFEALFLALAAALMPGVVGALGAGLVVAANLLSAAAMVGYLLWHANVRVPTGRE